MMIHSTGRSLHRTLRHGAVQIKVFAPARSIINISSIYVAEAVASGKGRNGFVKGSEGFETAMVMPKALGGMYVV